MSQAASSSKKHRNEHGDSKQKNVSFLKEKDSGPLSAKKGEKKKRKKKGNPKTWGVVSLSNRKSLLIKQLLNYAVLEDFTATDNNIGNSVFKRNFHGNIKDKSHASSLIKNDDLDETLLRELESKRETSSTYNQMLEIRKKLPAYKEQRKILDLLSLNQVLVISGRPGGGKTTQVAQFILDDYISKGKGSLCRIVCTQPRRISAISAASRVAKERAEPLGNSVGYQIRLERKLPRNRGSVYFCTTGVFLKQMENNPCLTEYSHLILDEIQERDISSDFLMTILKQVIRYNKDLRVILLCTPNSSEQFSKYFNGCPQVAISHLSFPIEEFYLEDVIERTGFRFEGTKDGRKKHKNKQLFENLKYSELGDFIEPYITLLEHKKYSQNTLTQLRNPNSEEINLNLILTLLIDICKKDKDKGAILVFLTGYMEISMLCTLMEESGSFPKCNYLILPLHSQMSTVDQKIIFEHPPQHIRKIILSTNIAERSVTIDDVVYVIDCGKTKIQNFNVKTKTETQTTTWVSLVNANQRKLRAGRVRPGICFHLFTKPRQNTLSKYIQPEVLRTRLDDVILMIKVLQLGKAKEFFETMLDPPKPIMLTISLKLLKCLNALDDDEKLTPLGYHLAKLPVAPQMGKMLLMGAIFSCLDPILSVAAFLDMKDAFQIPLGKEKLVREKKLELADGQQSDHLLFCRTLKRYEEFTDNCERERLCSKYFLSKNTLDLLINIKKQFVEYLYKMYFIPNTDPECSECNKNSDNLSLIKAVVCAGLYPNVLISKHKKKSTSFFTPEGESVEIHPRSVLSSSTIFESSLFVYYQKLQSSSIFVHDITLIHPLPLLFFGDKYKYEEDKDVGCVVSISDSIRFKCSKDTALTIKKLRNRLNWFLEYKISHPGVVDWCSNGEEVKVLRAIMELITSEDSGDT